MRTFSKMKMHVENIATNRSLSFLFHTLFAIVNRRIPIFPHASRHNVEDYLKTFMKPLHNGGFVDVGANVGMWTFYLAQKGFAVHAFEPSPRAYQVLKERAKSFARVHIYPYALGESVYKANLKLHHSSGHNGLVRKSSDFSGMQVSTIVRTLDSFKINDVGLIKIDTEGSEVPILLGAKQTILRERPRLIIEVHSPYKKQSQRITQILKELNYHWIVRYKTKVTVEIGWISHYKVKRQPHIIGGPN